MSSKSITKSELLQIRVSKELKARLDKAAEKKGLKSGPLARMWIIEKLNEDEKSG